MDRALVAQKLVAHAITLLAARPQSRVELQRKLLRVCARRVLREATLAAPFAPPMSDSGEIADVEVGSDCRTATAAALRELTERGLVDDVSYASWHVGQRASGARPRSRAHLSAELICAKGISADIARESLTDYSDLSACARAARKRLRVATRTPTATALIAALMRSGYQWRHVQRVVTAHAEGGDEAQKAMIAHTADDDDTALR